MDIQQVGDAKVVRMMERLDSMTCNEVESALQALIASNPRQVICDFSATKYISSMGLRVFFSAAKSLKRTGGRLALVCSESNYVHEIFELSGITHILPVFKTVDEAMVGAA
jgi:anti-anti-sigma factor